MQNCYGDRFEIIEIQNKEMWPNSMQELYSAPLPLPVCNSKNSVRKDSTKKGHDEEESHVPELIGSRK